MRRKTRFFMYIMVFQMFLILFVLITFNGLVKFAAAQEQTSTSRSPGDPIIGIGVGIAIGLSTIGSGIALKNVGVAAISSVTEREEGSIVIQFLCIAMCEALAIYGFIIAVLLWTLM